MAFQSSLPFGVFQLYFSLHQSDYVEFIYKFFIGNICYVTLRILSNLVQIVFKYISMVLAATAIMCSQYDNHNGFFYATSSNVKYETCFLLWTRNRSGKTVLNREVWNSVQQFFNTDWIEFATWTNCNSFWSKITSNLWLRRIFPYCRLSNFACTPKAAVNHLMFAILVYVFPWNTGSH